MDPSKIGEIDPRADRFGVTLRADVPRERRAGDLKPSVGVRPLSRKTPGLIRRGDAKARSPPMMPTDLLLLLDVDLLGTSEDGLGRTSARILPLPGGDEARVDADLPLLLDTEVRLIGELEVDHGCCDRVGEVFNRGNVGLAGTGRGLRNLSVGSMVRCSELVELTLSFRDRPPLLSAKGTFRTLTS